MEFVQALFWRISCCALSPLVWNSSLLWATSEDVRAVGHGAPCWNCDLDCIGPSARSEPLRHTNLAGCAGDTNGRDFRDGFYHFNPGLMTSFHSVRLADTAVSVRTPNAAQHALEVDLCIQSQNLLLPPNLARNNRQHRQSRPEKQENTEAGERSIAF